MTTALAPSTPREQISLYFPYLHFRDHDWLKAAVLYWDQVHRIVPTGLRNRTNDSHVVKYLQKNDIVINVNPVSEAAQVAPSFATWLMNNPTRVARLRVKDRDRTRIPPHRWVHDTADDEWDQSLAYVHAEKINDDLSRYLVQEGLGIPVHDHETGMLWFGMDPRLGNLYMTALAREIASRNNIHPLAAHKRDQIAVLEPTIDALANDLLTNRSRRTPSLTENQLKTRYLELTLPVVLPKHLGNISIERIVKARKNLAPAYRAFQDAITAAATQERVAQLNAMSNEEIRDATIRIIVQREFLEPYEELKARIGELGGETAERLLVVGVQLATVAKSGGLAFAMKALDLIPNVRAQHEQHRGNLRATPSAYLLRLSEEFQPSTKLTRLKRSLRRSVHGI